MTWSALVAQLDAVLVDRLGEPTTYTPAAGQPVTPKGIFDDAYQWVEAGDAGVSSSAPVVFYRLSDLPLDPDEDEPLITISGRTYKVAERRKDGQGGVHLRLHRIS